MNGTLGASPLDAVDYDPIDHLNALFTHPSALSQVGKTASALQSHQDVLSTEIAAATSALASSTANDSLHRMSSAKEELALLFRKIESVRTRAIETEQTITNMTAEIKRLDNTKRNLTLSMTALKRLQMLTTAYEQLRGLAKSRQYKDCASLLQAVLQLMAHFKSYRSIDQIATLSRNVADLQRELAEQVCEDFEMAFAKDEVAMRKGILTEACLVMDALGDSAKQRLITWYCNTMLREYRQVFRGNDEAGSLDNIGRRYSWFKRMWSSYEVEHASIFPSSWRVNEVLANSFCEGTRDDYKGILERQTRRTDGVNLDVALLLRCLQETLDFEHGLEKKFAQGKGRSSIDTLSSEAERSHTFDGSISRAFEPYLSLWVESRDRQLATMLPAYRNQPLIPADEEFQPQSVIASSIELFHFYKVTLAQCAKLSTAERLLDLSKTFAKYLDDYAQQVLLNVLQRNGASGPSLQDSILVLNTADYWHTNSGQLEENIKRRIDSEFSASVDFSNQSDTFMGVASAAVLALVHRVETGCEGAWREMRNTNWSKMESVGDQSSYVAELLKAVNTGAEEVLTLVTKAQYARAFCDKVVEALTSTYLSSVVLCRPVSEVGAEQMLLDKYVLTKELKKLLSLSPTAATHEHAVTSFQNRVQSSLSRLDPLLKTLQVRPSPPEGLVQAYLIHIGDKSDTNFKKILELKGIRKGEQPHLLELFQIHRESPKQNDLVASSPLLTPLVLDAKQSSNIGLGLSTPTIGSAAAPFAGSAATFGEKLFSAARDGVERMGTGSPALGGPVRSDSMDRAAGAVGAAAEGVGENLRGLGKFFRRDVSGGFSGRFGRSTEDGK